MIYNGLCVVQVTLEITTMDRVIQWSHSAYECATTYSLIMAFIEKWKYMWVVIVNWLYTFGIAFFICGQLIKFKVVYSRVKSMPILQFIVKLPHNWALFGSLVIK